MFDLEKSIQAWLKSFNKHRAFEEGTIQEMELHLRDHIEDLVGQGHSEKNAFEIAVESFGEIEPVGTEEYSNVKRSPSIRSIMLFPLLSNFGKTTTRGMLKNPLSSFINVFGLAVAIGACMVTYAFIHFDYSIDRFHTHKDHVFLSTFYVEREGTMEEYGSSPAPLGAMLLQDFSGIKRMTRVHDRSVVSKYEDNVFHEQVRMADPEFLEMFTFPLKWGLSSSLQDINSIILSHDMAEKYFGTENPIGADFKLIFGNGYSKSFQVSGVAEPFPQAHIISFDFLVNIQNLNSSAFDLDMNDWSRRINATFIQVDDPKEIGFIKEQMAKYKVFQNAAEPDWAITSFNFVSLHDLHLASRNIREDISYDASFEGRVGLPVIAGFILILACFNYINIAIVSAAKRLKEIGLRKVIGASKRNLIVQFVSENLLFTFFAGFIGLVLAMTVFLPWFSSFAGIANEFDLFDPNLWLFMFAILLFTGFVSGIYPAFYVAKFQVAHIFRGGVKFGQKNVVTKVFLALQMALACVGIAFAVMFAQNSHYQAQRDWGYDEKSALYLKIPASSSFETLKATLAQESDVLKISGSEHHISRSFANTILHFPDTEYEVQEISVDSDYLETLGLQMAEGRFFQPNSEIDYNALIVNELLVADLGLVDPIGTQVRIDSAKYEIVGIVKDFYFNNFYYEQRPIIFTQAKPEEYQYLSLKVMNGSQPKIQQVLQENWAELFPETPFNGGYQEDTWPGFYEDLETQQRFSRAIALVFVILTSLGLYGLLQLNIAGRIREFSIRKTLGAGVMNLASNVVNQYMLIFLVAVVIGIPLGYVLNTAMIDLMFPEPRPFGYSGAVISAVILIVVMFLVMASQVKRVVQSNPVEGLKVES